MFSPQVQVSELRFQKRRQNKYENLRHHKTISKPILLLLLSFYNFSIVQWIRTDILMLTPSSSIMMLD